MLKMNYSDFYYKNVDQIIKAAERRGISRYKNGKQLTRDDLIGEIIAHDAYYEGKEDARREMPEVCVHKTEKPRKKYRLQDVDREENYYLELTEEQVNFFTYLNQELDLFGCNCTLESISNIPFKAP